MAKTTKITRCSSCKPHEFQDKTYGPFMRVHNQCKSANGKTHKYRCTVCGKDKE